MSEKNKIFIENKAVISDPCYDRTNSYLKIQDKMLKGFYNWKVDKKLGDVHSIEIIHENYENNVDWELSGEVGVDSGTLGIFCDSIYPLVNVDIDESFFNKTSNIVFENSLELREHSSFLGDIELEKKEKNNNWLTVVKDDALADCKLYESLESFISGKEKEQGKSSDWEVDYYMRYGVARKKLYNYRYKIYSDYLIDKTIPEEPIWLKYGIVDNKGIVSSSGMGDGCYSYYTAFNNNNDCIGIKVIFLGEE